MKCRTLMVLTKSILKATLSGPNFVLPSILTTASSEEQGFAASFVAQPLILVRPMQRADHSINFGAFPNGCAEELEVVGEDVDLLPDFDAMCCRLYSAEGSLASCIVR